MKKFLTILLLLVSVAACGKKEQPPVETEGTEMTTEMKEEAAEVTGAVKEGAADVTEAVKEEAADVTDKIKDAPPAEIPGE